MSKICVTCFDRGRIRSFSSATQHGDEPVALLEAIFLGHREYFVQKRGHFVAFSPFFRIVGNTKNNPFHVGSNFNARRLKSRALTVELSQLKRSYSSWSNLPCDRDPFFPT